MRIIMDKVCNEYITVKTDPSTNNFSKLHFSENGLKLCVNNVNENWHQTSLFTLQRNTK